MGKIVDNYDSTYDLNYPFNRYVQTKKWAIYWFMCLKDFLQLKNYFLLNFWWNSIREKVPLKIGEFQKPFQTGRLNKFFWKRK